MTVERVEPDGYLSCAWIFDGEIVYGLFRSEMIVKYPPMRAPRAFVRRDLRDGDGAA